MKRLLVFIYAIAPLLAFATDETCPAGYYPAEYIELEYIESTGTQYINLNYLPSSNHRFYCEVMWTRVGDFTLFSAKENADWAKGTYLGVTYTSGNVFTWYSDVIVRGGSGRPSTHQKVVNTLYNINLRPSENKMTVNGVTILGDSSSRQTTAVFTAPRPFYLFAANSGGTANQNDYARIYKFEDYDENGFLFKHFIPVRRLSDGAVGMFDKVEGKFYGNSGTGEFIAGPEKTDKKYITDENGDIVCEPCPDNTYKTNAGNTECTKCPTGTFSPIGSKELSDCAKILHVGEYVVYMPLGKRTEHGLCVMWNGEKYCADVYKKQ